MMMDIMWKYIINLILLMRAIPAVSILDDCCEIKETTVICVGCIPKIIPQNVSVVLIHRVNFGEYTTEPPFNSTYWSHVTHLTILPDDMFQESEYMEFNSYTLRSKSFYHMQELQFLRITSLRLYEMQTAVFDGLDNIRNIDLTDCMNLNIESLTSGLTGSYLPELQALCLKGVYRLAIRAALFDSRFFDFLNTTKIEILDLSDTVKNSMDIKSFSYSMPYLRTLNIKNGGPLAANVLLAFRDYGNGSTFVNLKHIILNYPTIPEAALTVGNSDELQSKLNYPMNFTDIRIRRCTPVAEGYITDLVGVRDTTNTSIKIIFDFRIKDLKWNVLRVTTDNRAQSYLETFDLGENGIESIDSSVTNTMGRIKHLNISQNRFYKMNVRDFERMFWQMPLLESLNCSYNRLYFIPKETFRLSFNLKLIDISNNHLEHLDFDVSHLTDLKLLDASYNRIHTLDDITLDIFSNIFDNSKGFKLTIEGNPFECSCQNKDFIVWLIKKRSRMNTNYTCRVDSDRNDIIVVDQRAFRTIDHLCTLAIIYITAGISSAVVLIALIILTICCVRRHQKRKERLRFEKVIEMHRLNKTKEKIPVFLSYCSSDDGLVGKRILPMFNRKLQTLLRTDKQCVCTGDISFTPGFYVAEEIVKCIESSCVILACVSNKYCKSFFCKDEIMAAYQGGKPIILLFLEDVDIKQLPRVMQTHFNTITRAKVQEEYGAELMFTPEIDAICEAIVKLMQLTYSNK